jgi:hypothetical protein
MKKYSYIVYYHMNDGKKHKRVYNTDKSELWFVSRDIHKEKNDGKTIRVSGQSVDLSQCKLILVQRRKW